jgi:hypothetical protein
MKITFALNTSDSPVVATLSVHSLVAQGYAITIVATGRAAEDASIANLRALAERPAARTGKKATVVIEDHPED